MLLAALGIRLYGEDRQYHVGQGTVYQGTWDAFCHLVPEVSVGGHSATRKVGVGVGAVNIVAPITGGPHVG